MVTYLDKDNKPWTVADPSSQQKAYAESNGWKELSNEQASKLQAQQASDDQFRKDNSGLLGGLKVGAGQFADEFLGGIPEAIYDKTASPEDVRHKEMLKEMHPYVNAIAGVGGAVTSLFTPLGFLGKTAKAATTVGHAIEGLEATGRAANLAKGLVAGATEGAVMSAPSAAAQLIEGDPTTAGETLMVGSALGVGGKLFSALGSRAATAGQNWAQEQGAAKAVSDTGNYPISDTLAQKADLKNVVGKAAEYKTAGLGYAMGGPVGGFAAKEMLGPGVNSAVQGLVPEGINNASKQVAMNLGDLVVEKLNEIPNKLKSLNESGYSPVTVSSGLGSQIMKLKSREDWKNHTEAMNQLASSQPSQTNDPLEDSLHKQQIKVAQELIPYLPKIDYMDEPFVKNNAVPTDEDKKLYLAKVELAMNPFTIFDKAANGTLKGEDVKMVKALYPNLYAKFDDAVMSFGLTPRGKRISKSKMDMINIILQQDIDKSWSPEYVKLTQQQYAQQPPKQNNNNMNLPNAATEVQQLNQK